MDYRIKAVLSILLWQHGFKIVPIVLKKIFYPLLIQLLLSRKTCSLKENSGLQILPRAPWKLWNVFNEFCVRDATTLAARNPGFVPAYVTFSHKKLLAIHNNHSLLCNGINKITDLLEELWGKKCSPCLWMTQVNWHAWYCSPWCPGNVTYISMSSFWTHLMNCLIICTKNNRWEVKHPADK